MNRNILFVILISLVLLIGCDSQPETVRTAEAPPTNQPPPEPQPQLLTYDLLREPMEPLLVETSSEVLPLWSKSLKSQPILVLLSNDPFLKPVPQVFKEDAVELVKTGNISDALADLDPSAPDPLFFPQMVLDVALQSQLFSQVFWVISGDESFKQQTAESFGKHLVSYGAISATEANTFSRNEHGFTGQIHGRPFTAVHESSLPTITGPVLLHIDLSYFKPIYKGEIKTPLYSLLYQTLNRLRAANLSTAAVSISLSNLGGNLPLATRFIGQTLSKLFLEPQLLDAPLPDNWEIRRQALYLENFFQKEKVHELTLGLQTNTPQDASASYALYRSLRELKKGSEALAALAEAVRLEPAYGLEYLTLSATALEKKRPDQALKMLDLAITAFPDNPFIPLQKAELLIQLGHSSAAVDILRQLQQVPWSGVYYAQLPDYIDSLLTPDPSTTD